MPRGCPIQIAIGSLYSSDHPSKVRMSSGFGIFFVGCTCPIPHTAFAQTDSNHWVRAGSAIMLPLLIISSIVLILERK